MSFEIMARPCDQCLMTRDKIVSNERRTEIMRETAGKDCHFICHKATIAGRDIACRSHFDITGGGRLGRFAFWLGYVRYVDPNTLETVHPNDP